MIDNVIEADNHFASTFTKCLNKTDISFLSVASALLLGIKD